MCDLNMHMCRYDSAEVELLIFRTIGFQRCHRIADSKGGIKGSATSVVASSFELNQCFTSVSGLNRLFIRQLRQQSDIWLATA